MRRFPQPRGRYDRKPVGHIPGCAAAEMRYLADETAIMPVDALRELLEIRDDAVRAHVDLAEHRGRIR